MEKDILRKFIKENFLKEDGSLNTVKLRESYLKKYGIYEDVMNFYNDSNNISESIYRIAYDIDEKPRCKFCNKPLRYDKGFKNSFCSRECHKKYKRTEKERIEKEQRRKDLNENVLSDRELFKDYIRKYVFSESGRYRPNWVAPEKIKERLPEVYEVLRTFYSDSESIVETIYRIVHDIEVRPTCKVCGGHLKFNNMSFPRYCSRKCSNADPEVLEKIRNSCSNSLRKAYRERGNEIRKKRSQSLKEHYGEESISPYGIKSIQNKIKETIKERYGVENVLTIKEHQEKAKQRTIEVWKDHWKKLGYDIEYLPNEKVLVRNGCKVHGDIIISQSTFNNRMKEERRDHTILCEICNPLDGPTTSIESIIEDFLIENDIRYDKHNRTVIKPLELDFYLPDYKIGIECNGMYWHSELRLEDKDFHVKKLEACQEKGVQLLFFWEDQLIKKRQQIYDYIASKLGIFKRKIYARECEVKEISSSMAKEFIEENHIQGYIPADKKYGLFYKNELVMVETFGKRRIFMNQSSKEGEYELYRLCSKNGVQIIGGSSKLFLAFVRDNDPSLVISYANREISTGNVYERMGFSLKHRSRGGYFYISNQYPNQRFSRFRFRKSEIDDGTGRTEHEIMLDKGFYRCYDCGQMRFEWHKPMNEKSVI